MNISRRETLRHLVQRRGVRELAVLAAIVFAASLTSACRGGTTPPPAAATAVDSADQVMFKARSLITDRGLLRAELISDTAMFFDENTRAEMRGVNTTFHNASGAKTTTLTSRKANYDMRRNMMEARGQVVVVSVDGRKLSTEQLKYDASKDEISSDSAFVLTEPGRSLEGIGFRSDPGMQNFRVLRGAKGSAGTVAVPQK